MNRIGHDNNPNSATNPISCPVVIAPDDTRHEPTASRRAVASVGRASKPGFEGRPDVAAPDAIVAERLAPSRRAARPRRPRVRAS